MAISAGYFFKCPTCNGGEKFVKEMKAAGVFVPDQDASWEQDNAFEDLYVQYSKCDAKVCLCRDGRDHATSRGNWVLARCRLCGAAGTHKKCANVRSVQEWACEECVGVEEKARKVGEEIDQVTENVPIVSAPEIVEPTTSQSNLNEDAEYSYSTVDFSKLRINKPGSLYFPYTKERLSEIAETAILPDWRNMVVHVNLCTWLMHNLHPEDAEDGSVATNEAYMENVEQKKTVKKITTAKRSRRRTRPPSKWSKGYVRKSARRIVQEELIEEVQEDFNVPPINKDEGTGAEMIHSVENVVILESDDEVIDLTGSDTDMLKPSTSSNHSNSERHIGGKFASSFSPIDERNMNRLQYDDTSDVEIVSIVNFSPDGKKTRLDEPTTSAIINRTDEFKDGVTELDGDGIVKETDEEPMDCDEDDVVEVSRFNGEPSY